ncbi:MAG TPA: condensation domain-containing protein, partial [Kouleothrix sp.]|nr:condensation domain-containing protein [Kouleothrix sp.]
ARVRETCLDAYAHQDLPFDLLINELQPARSLQRAPLFQVVLVLQNTPLPPLQLDDVLAEPQAVDPGVAKFDLVFEFREGPAGLAGILTYDTDLFEAPTIARMAGRFLALLEALERQPGERLSALVAQLGEAERRADLSQAQALRAAQQGRLKSTRRKALTGGT